MPRLSLIHIWRRRRYAYALDAHYTKQLADAKAENDALRRKLDNGGRVFD
ncbi:lysis protein, partial [Escherichia coli]|nr:lysis protein [Escherichia coli]